MTHRLPLGPDGPCLPPARHTPNYPASWCRAPARPQVFTDLSTDVAAAMPDDHLYPSGGNPRRGRRPGGGQDRCLRGAGIHPDSSSVHRRHQHHHHRGTQVLTRPGSTFTGIKFMNNRMEYGDGNGNDSPPASSSSAVNSCSR